MTQDRACTTRRTKKNLSGWSRSLSQYTRTSDIPSRDAEDTLCTSLDPAGSDSKLESNEEVPSSSEDDSDWDDVFVQSATPRLPSGIDPDERLMNPSYYFGELENLETEVFLHSAFKRLGPHGFRSESPRPVGLAIDFPYSTDRSQPEISDLEATATCRALLAKVVPAESTQEPFTFCTGIFLQLIACRNVISAVLDNLSRLSRARFCGSYISILALQNDRNVARLVRVTINEVTILKNLLDDALKARYEYLRKLTGVEPVESSGKQLLLHEMMELKLLQEEDHLTAECRNFLFQKLDGEYIDVRDVQDIWRCVVHVLDLAVLSYVGAHVGNFDEHYLSSPLNPGQSSSLRQESKSTQSSINGPVMLDCQIRFSRLHHLRCLDRFLGQRPVWTFERNTIQAQSLYLSTDIETFADIWGPLWKVFSRVKPQNIVKYNVGGGSITPWPVERDEMGPPLREGEVYSHWELTVERAVTGSQQSLEIQVATQLCFDEDDILLIGGSSSRLWCNPECRCEVAKMCERLRNSTCLQPAGTSKSSRVQDAETVQVQLGGSGVQVGYQRSFKLRTGQTWKQAILESWENSPERRNPWLLQEQCGAEISMCTRNSRRIRLIEVLRTQTMRNFMKLYTWRTEQCRDSYHKALNSEDLSALSILMIDEKDPERRGEYGSALSTCFKALSATGLCDNSELSLFWAPEPGLEYLAMLLRSEHTWTGFLKDSVYSCTFAVLENKCLISPTAMAGIVKATRRPSLSAIPCLKLEL